MPGGRFGELYYRDSYFTMLGLVNKQNAALLHHTVKNFAYLIDTYGHIPNDRRSYYLSRSQPPVFVLMIELTEATGGKPAVPYLPQLQQEYGWWMADSRAAVPGGAHPRVVRLTDGRLLNRYRDDKDTPREESWREDVTTVRASQRDPAEVYRHLRAACESNWDFSSRWLAESEESVAKLPSLSTIGTTDIVPVDLNAFLYELEIKIADLSRFDGAHATGREFTERAQQRKAAMLDLMWNSEQGAFFDHDWRLGKQRASLTAATVVPLFVGLADPVRANVLAATVERRLLAHGGLATSEEISAQQWDCPNGWAPLQCMAIRGFADYGHDALSQTIAGRWLATVAAIYEREGKLIEKYGLRQDEQDATQAGDGGKYPLQDGFGWTNGVTAALLAEQPDHSAHVAVALIQNSSHR